MEAITLRHVNKSYTTYSTEVVLTGGCMQNKVLFESLVRRLEASRFTVFAGEQAPMNDGGIALGQAFIGGNPCV